MTEHKNIGEAIPETELIADDVRKSDFSRHALYGKTFKEWADERPWKSDNTKDVFFEVYENLIFEGVTSDEVLENLEAIHEATFRDE